MKITLTEDQIKMLEAWAQELFEVLPQYVSEGDEDRNWGVAKSELVPLLVKSIQELKAEIDSLKNQIK